MRLPVSSTYFRKIILFDPEYLSILGTRESLAMLQTTFVNTICSALNYRRPGLILSCLLFLSSVCLKGQSAQEILDRYLDTVSYGDVSKWSKVKTLYTISHSSFGSMYIDFMPPQRNTGSYQLTYKKWPDKMKQELYSDSLFKSLTSEFFLLRIRDLSN